MFVHEGSGVGFPASPALWIRVLRYFSSSLHLAIFFSDVKLFFGEAFNDGLILHPRAAFVKRAVFTKTAPGSRIFCQPCIRASRAAKALSCASIPSAFCTEPGSCAVCMRQNFGGRMAVLLRHIAPSSCRATISLPEYPETTMP